MYAYLATAALSAELAFSAAWKIQSVRWDAQGKQRAEQVLENERAQARSTIRKMDTVLAAQNSAAARSADLRRDAERARDSLDGLRNATAAAVRSASSDLDACSRTATALGDVFQSSAAAYRELAEVCDRHVNDVRLMLESSAKWPGTAEISWSLVRQSEQHDGKFGSVKMPCLGSTPLQ